MSSELLRGFRLGPWKVEPLRGAVTGPQGNTRHLEPKVMDVFVCLAEHGNILVTREELQEAVWNGHAVTDEPLTRAIGELRRALEDGGEASQYIETVPKRGYRLIGQIRLPDGTRIGKKLTQSGSAIQLKKSIAVLPFVNMSNEPDNEFFSDGLSEEILNLLTRIPNLKVIGRTSSFAFKGKNEDLRVIGQTLGVKTILEGSVRKSGNRVRITAQLNDVSDGARIWSETYDRTLSDIFAVQDDVAAAIIDALQLHVSVNPTRGRPTENTEAYGLFLRATASSSASALRFTEELLLQAIDIDPKFAEAYELLAHNYYVQASEQIKAADAQKLVYEAAASALAIDPDLVLAQALYHSGKIEGYSPLGEIEAFERATRQQPGNSVPLHALSWILLESGYLQEALGLAKRFVELDPLSLAANYLLAEALYAAGSTSEALAALEVAEQLDPGGRANWRLGELNLLEGQDDAAITNFESWLQKIGYADLSWVRDLVTGARDLATGQACLDCNIPKIVASVPEEDAYSWQINLTLWYLFFGFSDRFFEVILSLGLSGSAWADADGIIYLGTVNRRLGFTAHPKYLEVAEALDFTGLWEQRGPPDFCEKVGGDWVCE